MFAVSGRRFIVMKVMITASVVTYRTSHEELAACLQSLLAGRIVCRVYIIDHAGDDTLAAFCRDYGDARIEYIARSNTGYGAGHNVALRRVLAEGVSRYHLVINSDVYFSSGVLENLFAYMETHSDVGQVIPNVVYPDGRQQHVCRLLPTPADLFFRRFLPASWSRRRMERYTLAFTGYDRPMNVPYHMGCFMLLRVESLREVGLFDERFFLYPEDIDLTRRIHRHYRTMFFPDVTIVHAHHAASYRSWRMLWIHIYNMCKYFNKWGWWNDPERRDFNRRLLKELASG